MIKKMLSYLFGFKGYTININIFFAIVFSGLIAIFVLFKPMEIQNKKFNDLALFELGKFTMYELNTEGLDTLTIGSKAFRYTNRYIIEDVNYTDNSKEYIANIESNTGVYKGLVLNLDGDVVYTREDGLTFESQHVTYNKKTSIAISKDKYFAYKQNNTVKGNYIKYNNKKNKIYSKNVVAVYKLKEENK